MVSMKEKGYFQNQAGRRCKQAEKSKTPADSIVVALSPILRPNPPTASQRQGRGQHEKDQEYIPSVHVWNLTQRENATASGGPEAVEKYSLTEYGSVPSHRLGNLRLLRRVSIAVHTQRRNPSNSQDWPLRKWPDPK